LIEALGELDIGNHHLVSEQRARLAERLAALIPDGLSYTVFGVGGGEAVDLAIKLARGYTGRHKIVSALGGYHGHTGLALATGDEAYRTAFGPNPPRVPADTLQRQGCARKGGGRLHGGGDLRDHPGHVGHAHPGA